MPWNPPLQVRRGPSDALVVSAGSKGKAVRQQLARLLRPLHRRDAGQGTTKRRQLTQGSSTRKWRIGTAPAVVLDALTTTAATPPTAPGLAVEIFNGGNAKLPIPPWKVPVGTAVAPCLNYTDANSVHDGLEAPLFALAGRTLSFDLRFTGDDMHSYMLPLCNALQSGLNLSDL